MTRKKVKLAYITNDAARKATFKKRKKGLLKKVSELSTLCGVEACAIIYSPYDAQPVVWPSPGGARSVLSEFKKMPEMEQSKKMVSQESFLRQRIAKTNEQLKRQMRDNREKEMAQVMFQCLAGKGLENLNMMDLNDLGWLLDQKLKDIDKKIDTLTQASHNQKPATTASATLTTSEATPKSGEKVQSESSDRGQVSMEATQRQQWIKDLMHPPEHVGLGSLLQFGDNIPTALWSNAFFPWEK